MSRIVCLPHEVSQKIAAGEVIERPYSVVKELVENSLDAGASDIRVEVVEGGKSLIRITDNGHGMSPEDARICFERHSTSKVSSIDDLDRITTLGFRGEALASISAVSSVILKTSETGAGKGIQIEHQDGRLLDEKDTAFPEGTSVEVKDLFYNLPARRKFLRTDRAELTQITKYLTHAALSNPDVKFSLRHGKRQLMDLPPVKGLKERIFQVFGKEQVERLLEVRACLKDMELFGYATRPPQGRKNKSQQMFFVNKRPVRDKVLLGALNQSYKGLLERDRFPEAFLFFKLPFEEVDVNVHPTKSEVRFKDSSDIFRFVRGALEQAILKEAGIKEISPAQHEDHGEFRVREEPAPLIFEGFKGKLREPRAYHIPPGQPDKSRTQVLGQYQETYIVAVHEGDLLVVDQHNAHERVLYDKYLKIQGENAWPRKMPLTPVLFDLSPSQILSYEENHAVLEGMGFRVEDMGNRSYALKEFPEIFDEHEARAVFLSLLDDVKGSAPDAEERSLLASMACHTAVKAGEQLTLDKMNYLVEQLFQTTNPGLCPHGRPILIKIGKKEIEKGMGRERS